MPRNTPPHTSPREAPRPLAVFDLDGTLVDTAPDLTASLNHCLARRGMPPVPLAMVRPFAGHGSRAMLTAAYGWENRPIGETELEDQVACFLSYYEAHIACHSQPFDGSLDALARLSDAGFTLAVCTNKSEKLARLLLSSLKIDEHFSAIAGFDTFAARKPDPAHLLGTIAMAKGARESAVMIGDTATDTKAAENIAIPSILMTFGYDANEAARAGATHLAESYDELTAELLNGLILQHPY